MGLAVLISIYIKFFSYTLFIGDPINKVTCYFFLWQKSMSQSNLVLKTKEINMFLNWCLYCNFSGSVLYFEPTCVMKAIFCILHNVSIFICSCSIYFTSYPLYNLIFLCKVLVHGHVVVFVCFFSVRAQLTEDEFKRISTKLWDSYFVYLLFKSSALHWVVYQEIKIIQISSCFNLSVHFHLFIIIVSAKIFGFIFKSGFLW